MRKLASNAHAVLVKCGKEYWIISNTLELQCVNEQSEDYSAKNALAYFVSMFGEATYIRKDIEWF